MRLRLSALAAAIALSSHAIADSSCAPDWLPYFRAGDLAYPVRAMLRVGDVVYLGGDFNSAGPIRTPGLVAWSEPHGFTEAMSSYNGPLNEQIESIVLFDEDGDGPAEPTLIVGGFLRDTPLGIEGVARVTPSGWQRIGELRGRVRKLVVMDVDDVPTLFAMGDFTVGAGAVGPDHPVTRIVQWTGDDWVSLPGILEPTALGVYDTGTEQTLYASGRFNEIITEYRVAHWNGAAWTLVPGRLVNGQIHTFCSYDPGPGITRLYVGGTFTSIEGHPSSTSIAAWNGSNWQTVGSGVFGGANIGILDMVVHDAGDGPRLFIGGRFTNAGGAACNGVASYSFNNWRGESTLANDGHVRSLASAALPDGAPVLYVGGEFTQPALNLLRHQGADTRPLTDAPPSDNLVSYAETITFGGNTSVYMSGSIDAVDGGVTPCDNVVRWNDQTGWTVLSNDTTGAVHDLIVYNTGPGLRLIAGGGFNRIGGVNASRLAQWNGAAWSSFGGGANELVEALVLFDSGSGPELYACGQFTQIGGVDANRIARFSGGTWHPLASGLDAPARAMAVFDDGSGPALYVGGEFTNADSVPMTRAIARWNGAGWSAVGTGVLSGTSEWRVTDLVVHDDGAGPRLIAAGAFRTPDVLGSVNVGAWDGQDWTALGVGLVGVAEDLESLSFGGKSLLMVIGPTQTQDGLILNKVGVWDGESWAALSGGLSVQNVALVPYALAAIQVGGRPAALVTGAFSGAGPLCVQGLAIWGCTMDTVTCPGDTNGDNVVDFADLNTVLSQYNQAGQGLSGDLNDDQVVDFADLNLLLGNYNLVCS